MRPRSPGKDRSLRGLLYVDRQDTKTFKLRGAVRDWQVRCVCGGSHLTCNNGWMRLIENQAKLVMSPIITGEETRLSSVQQGIIASWAALICIVAECDFDGRPITHLAQRKHLMRWRKPPTKGWAVWIGHYERQFWEAEFIQWPFQVSNRRQAELRCGLPPACYNSNAATQVVGKLFIHTLHCQSHELVDRWSFDLPHHGTLYRIWPPSHHSIKWPGLPLTDNDADAAANAVRDFLLDLRRAHSS